jgi:hypothetical protein
MFEFLCEQVVMSGKHQAQRKVIVKMIENTVSNSVAIKSAGSSAELPNVRMIKRVEYLPHPRLQVSLW